MAKLYENTRKPMREGKLITIGKADALPDGRGATIQLKNETEIALFNVGGRFLPSKTCVLIADIRLLIQELTEKQLSAICTATASTSTTEAV